MKKVLCLACLMVALSCAVATAQTVRTEWRPLEKSLTALLNEGWRIISHTNASLSTGLPVGVNSFSFVLMRENKVVICMIDSPEPNNAGSRCRMLN